MQTHTKIFLVEDEPVSAGITLRMLEAAGFGAPSGSAGTLAEALPSLAAGDADVILTDLGLPDSRGVETVTRLCAAFAKTPVVVMTGTDDEATGLEALKHGAQDYLVKGQFDHRELKRVIDYAIERKTLLNEKEELIAKLQDSLKRVHLLTGLLPTCCECRKIRNPDGKWVQMETYISGHSEAVFSHGFCDDCFKRHLAEMGKKK